MQSISLERQGGEKKVDFKLQETTFVQHTFGGRLRSKVNYFPLLHFQKKEEAISYDFIKFQNTCFLA